MNRLVFPTMVLLALVPLVSAQGEPERPDDAAWVEDCPPDMMCAAQSSGESCMDGVDEGEQCDGDLSYYSGPTRGPDDGSCEYCRGNDDSPAVTEDQSHTNAPIRSAGDEKAVPAGGFALVAAAIGAAMILLARRA